MIKNKTFATVITGLLCMLVSVNASTQPIFSINRTIKAELSLLKISAEIQVANTPQCIFDSAAYGWGAENTCPSEIVRAVSVFHAGRRQIVPLSAFADLGSPRAARLIGTSSKNFTLLMTGGEASTAYTAYLKFNGTALVSRKVESGEFPKESNEITMYKFNTQSR